MHADAGRWSFVPGLVVSGFGLGFVWTLAYSLATRDLSPKLGGEASGVINTIQELGTVIATAVIGAVLQNRLAIAMHAEAGVRASAIDEGIEEQTEDGIEESGRHDRASWQVGSSRSTGSASEFLDLTGDGRLRLRLSSRSGTGRRDRRQG